MGFGLGKIIGIGERVAATAAAEKLTAQTLSKSATKEAERFLTSTGDTLLGVRGNVAVVQNRAPFNNDLSMTLFYDITKPTQEAWLKTKYVTNGKLDYIPFGARSVDCHIPQNVRFVRQRMDLFPSEMGGGLQKSKNIVTRFFDKFNNMVEKVNVKTKSLTGGKNEQIVRSEYITPQQQYVTLDPINKPKNGSLRGFANINRTNGETEYFIQKG